MKRLLTILLLLVSPALAQITLGNHSHFQNQLTTNAGCSISVTAGQVVLVAQVITTSSARSATGSRSGSYTLLQSGAAPGGWTTYIYGAIAPSSGTETITSTYTGTATWHTVMCAAYNNLTLTKDQTGVSNGSNQFPTLTLTTVTQANELFFVYMGRASSTTWNNGTNGVVVENALSGDAIGHRILSATGAQACDFNMGATDTWNMVGVTLLGSGGGPPPPTKTCTMALMGLGPC